VSPRDRQAAGRLRVTWVKSAIGSDQRQRSTLKGLGLRRLNHTVEVPDVPAVRGMIAKVAHLVRLED